MCIRDRLEVPQRPTRAPRSNTGRIRLSGATLNNLQQTDLTLECGAFHVIVGPSGSGKSSLLFGTLLPALAGERGGPYEALEFDQETRVLAVDARPMGRSSRSTPGTWSGVFDVIRKRFAATEPAKRAGLKASAFSFNAGQGRCPACEGLGTVRVGLHLLEDAVHTCPGCEGRRYGPEVLGVTLAGRSIAEVLDLSIEEAAGVFSEDDGIAPSLRAMVDLGIGYLKLGVPSTTLSSGESQRIRLATLLAKPTATKTLLAFDEPDRGMHPSDLERLLDAYDRLLERGHTIVAISHHRQVWAAADRLIELNAGVATPRPVRAVLDEVAKIKRSPRPQRGSAPGAIRLRGVTTHNLAEIDVDIPHGQVTAILGPSGSGKSSLAFDTIAAEAWHRFAESLPFQVRRFMQRLARPPLRSAEGLTPTIALRQTAPEPDDRATLATLSGLGPHLRLAWSRCADLEEPLSAAHFRPQSGLLPCGECGGLGLQRRCTEASLCIDGSLTIAAGAFGATKPGRFLTEPDGQHLATMRAATDHDLELPWSELPESVRKTILGGLPDRELDVVWNYRRGGRSGEHRFRGTWDGLLRLAQGEATKREGHKQAAQWREPLVEFDCEACHGCGLAPEAAGASLEGLAYHQALDLPLERLQAKLADRRESSPGFATLWPELAERFEALIEMGLGGLRVAQPARDMSRSELQRVRLAGIMRSDLSGTTLVLDEPSSGLDEAAAKSLADRLREQARAGNTVIVVTHRQAIFEGADHAILLGEGAGPNGGRVLMAGPCADPDLSRKFADWFRPRPSGAIRAQQPDFLHLPSLGLTLPRTGLVCLPVEEAKRMFDAIERLDLTTFKGAAFKEVVRAAHLVTASTPLYALGAMPHFQALFFEAAKAAGQDLPKAAFSYQSPKGRCPTCKGTGNENIALDFLANLNLPCPDCHGTRYRPEVLEVRFAGLNPAEFLATPIAALELEGKTGLTQALEALHRVGLGHLSLGRATKSLSGGELERLALARLLIKPTRGALYLLDDPARGLSERDLGCLFKALRYLVESDCCVLCATDRETLGSPR